MYKEHEVVASVYWIGEGATADNDFISNVPSAWDSRADLTFGGVDNPEGRGFEPNHNTFYFALPAAEYTAEGLVVGAREASPWADEPLAPGNSLFKGRWVEITHGEQVAYAQWHDVGPNEEFDYDYVFAEDEPANTFGLQAGIDVSPDTAKHLGFNGSGTVSWKFVDAQDVPEGPWNDYPAIDSRTNW